MQESFSPDLAETMARAKKGAADRRHECVTVEHVLLALCDDAETVDILSKLRANVAAMRQRLADYLDSQQCLERKSDNCEPANASGLTRVLQRALIHARSVAKEAIDPSNVLVAMFTERDTFAVKLLGELEVTRYDIVNELQRRQNGAAGTERTAAMAGAAGAPALKPGQKALEAYCVNLNEKAAKDAMPLVGRDMEIQRVVEVLARKTKNNPLLVGEPGVGKTAVAEGLAQRINGRRVPNCLLGATVYALDLGRMLAGTRYRGDFEERLKSVIDEVQAIQGGILFIDEIHTLIGAGDSQGGLDASNIMKPDLAEGTLRCIGATTFAEYRRYFEKDAAMTRRFQKVQVAEPTAEQALAILQGVAPKFAAYHGVEFGPGALEAAVRLSVRHITDRRMPDKAIDVIDEAAAALAVSATGKASRVVDIRCVEEAIAKIKWVPVSQISGDELKALARLGDELKLHVFGQDEAIETLVSAIQMARAGLRAPTLPGGCFLFGGPTGVGKTELCKQLAAVLGLELVRFDMSEYMEKHTVSRLIGAPPGYVGNDKGGLLTDAVDKSPYCVLLLDEVEKAHPDIFNVLLQVMSDGRLTDSDGKTVDFRNVILVLTTNQGAESMERNAIGFGRDSTPSGDVDGAMRQLFSPELRNRLDATVMFKHLAPDVMSLVVDKQLAQLEGMLHERRCPVALDVADEVREWLAEKGYDRHHGARPLQRLVDAAIKKPMATELLFGALAEGGIARFEMGVDGPVLTCSKATEPAAKQMAN